ncbi:MAG: hypothetical protein FK733_13220 [Asgard group archaeon]|nr:hypothetical protein [Asgard group archaeon]
MSETNDKEAEIAKFPGIASISLSITPVGKETDFELIEAIVRVYDENDEQIMQQKARSLFTIAKNLKLFIQNRTDLPINDRRMSVWFSAYLSKINIKIEEDEAYQLIKKASQALEKVSRVTIEHVESSDLVSIETDVLANLMIQKTDRLLSEDELHDLLEENQAPVSNTIERTIRYKNSGGVEHKDKLKLEVQPGEEPFDHSLIASFKNDSPTDLTDVIISDIIPYCFKLLDVKCEKGGKYKKTLIEDGLKLEWKIKNVPSGGEVKAHYNFEARIPRTIMIRKGEEIRIVQDYNTLLREESDEGKIKTYFVSEVINLLPITLDEMIIRDLIPMEMAVTTNSITDEMEILDFGQNYGFNIQQVIMNVETGTKFLHRYDIIKTPLIWKIDLSIPAGEDFTDDIHVTKILEKVPNKDVYICTIMSSTPKPCTISNELESGLSAKEFVPTNLSPEDNKKMRWDVDANLAVSMVLSGNLTRLPNPIKITIDGKEHSAEPSEFGHKRKSQLISLPFNHVVLYRKSMR